MLPVLYWTMAISQLIAQKNLPASIEPYAANWGYPLKRVLLEAGFDVPGPQPEYGLRPLIQQRSEELRLDSTLTYFGYDQPGLDSLPLFRNVYTYPQEGTEIIVEYYYDQDHWIPLNRTVIIRDDLGRIVDSFTAVYDEESGEFNLDTRIEIFRRGMSPELVDSFFVSAWSVEVHDWIRTMATWNTFDGQERLSESLSSVEFFQVPLVFLDRYHYNPDGDLVVIESFNIEGDEEIPSQRQEMWYVDHQLHTQTTLVSDGAGGFVAQTKLTFTYTSFGSEELIQNFEYDFDKNDWKLIQVLGFVYDDQQRVSLKETNTLDPSGIWIRAQSTYTYQQDEYVAAESGYRYDSNLESWILENKKYYYYDDLTSADPDPVADARFLLPNPTEGAVQIKLPGKVSVYIYSLSGQLLGKYNLGPGERMIDLSFLPAGLYQVRAKSDDDYFSGKLIIL